MSSPNFRYRCAGKAACEHNADVWAHADDFSFAGAVDKSSKAGILEGKVVQTRATRQACACLMSLPNTSTLTHLLTQAFAKSQP